MRVSLPYYPISVIASPGECPVRGWPRMVWHLRSLRWSWRSFWWALLDSQQVADRWTFVIDKVTLRRAAVRWRGSRREAYEISRVSPVEDCDW